VRWKQRICTQQAEARKALGKYLPRGKVEESLEGIVFARMYRRLEVDMEVLLLTKEWGRASEEARYLCWHCWGSSAEMAVEA
jgi:hypothetical protein